jgi:hypothetical protein
LVAGIATDPIGPYLAKRLLLTGCLYASAL